jgi:RNA polymerase sigma-70 factor (ECF subfamily)
MSLEYQEITALYERYGKMVLRRCRQLLRDESQAEDAAQNVFVLFLTNRDRLTAEFPSSLLNRIATNHCLNLIRDDKRHRSGSPTPWMPASGASSSGVSSSGVSEWLRQVADWEDPVPRLEARSMLKRLFGLHEESTRTMAVMHLLDGMTLEEVAEETGMSVSGVRKRLRGLRESLLALEEK